MTLNEAHNLPDCLASLATFDEVVVVDSGSTDRTVEIAEEWGARVVPFSWNGRYPQKKEWSLRNAGARNDWVLFVDADERVPPALVEEIGAFLNGEPRHSAMAVRYNYVFLSKTLRFGYRPEKIILVRRSRCRFPYIDPTHVPHMWEVEGHYQPEVDGTVDRFRSRMLHDDADDLYSYFARHNRYSDWEAVIDPEAFVTEASSTAFRLLAKRAWYRMPLRGTAAFIHSYFIRLGFLDGRPGLHYALARAFYYWQVGVKRRSSKQARTMRTTSRSGRHQARYRR